MGDARKEGAYNVTCAVARAAVKRKMVVMEWSILGKVRVRWKKRLLGL